MADYWVVKNKTAGWDVKRSGAERASSNHNTQQEAIDAAHPLINDSGGGELIVHDEHGQIRDTRTIGKPDPYPPAG